jgi:hypothetical protein
MTTARRAGSAAALAGALGLTIPMSVAPATAQTEPPTPAAASAAAPAPARLALKHVRRNITAGRRAVVRGTLRAGRAGIVGRRVVLRARRHGRWQTVDRARTTRAGAFRLAFRPRAAGTLALVAVVAQDGMRRSAGRVNVFRPASASWYGPGLYGGKLACGGTLGPGTLGVAHKTLPCGTRITLRHRGHSVRVPVIDRGPFVAGREFDLTAATKQRLGFGSTGMVLSTR